MHLLPWLLVVSLFFLGTIEGLEAKDFEIPDNSNIGTSTLYPDLYEASVLELQAGLDKGLFTSVDLVKVVLIRFFVLPLPAQTYLCRLISLVSTR